MPESLNHPGKAPRAFISYARTDGEAYTRNLSTRLEKEGIPCWMDRFGQELATFVVILPFGSENSLCQRSRPPRFFPTQSAQCPNDQTIGCPHRAIEAKR